MALGINCIALENTTAALKHLHSLTALPLVVYPNSGEHYDAVTKTRTITVKRARRWRVFAPVAGGRCQINRWMLSHHAERYC